MHAFLAANAGLDPRALVTVVGSLCGIVSIVGYQIWRYLRKRRARRRVRVLIYF